MALLSIKGIRRNKGNKVRGLNMNSNNINLKTRSCSRGNKDLHATLAGGFGFHSSHVLINKERTEKGMHTLKRNVVLDSLCKLHAEVMAEEGRLLNSVDSVEELKELVNSEHAGETVLRGESVKDIHQTAVEARKHAYKNMVGKKFTEFGAATARGEDGRIYVVQLYRGPTVLPEPSTSKDPSKFLLEEEKNSYTTDITADATERSDETTYAGSFRSEER